VPVRLSKPFADNYGRFPMATRVTPMELDLRAIEASLCAVQQELGVIGVMLGAQRDALDDRTIANMLEGYAYVERVVNAGLDPFSRVANLLELNRLALCGTDPARRHEFRSHLEATEQRFYEEANAGINDVVEWARHNAGRSVWQRAAGIYLRILAKPQLFIEGNHRTGTLVMSWVLMRGGQPPFVLSTANARKYFSPSATIRDIAKNSILGMLRLPRIQRRFAEFIQHDVNMSYLLPHASTDQDAPRIGVVRRAPLDTPLARPTKVRP
jgi:Fic/DOC family